ncbi:MAG: RNA polymerase sigma factor [Acidobacteriota bacterium]
MTRLPSNRPGGEAPVAPAREDKASHAVSRPPSASALESTASLLELVREGNIDARERLIARCLPLLRRWAHGRLPNMARGMVDTDDLVQVSLLRALNQVGRFEPRREGAFLAYLRRIILNAVRDEVRRAVRRPGGDEPPEDIVDRAPSLVEQAIGHEIVERYEAALATLAEIQQEAVILRVEFGFSYQEIADAIVSPSANAARMMVSRALVRLAEAMDGLR